MLSFNQVALRRGTQLLFSDVSFTIHSQRKVGLIGANGAGKTSLFKMIVGELESDEGEIDYPANLRIAHLKQEVAATSEPALEYVLGGDSEFVRIQDAIEKAEASGEYDNIASLHEQLDSIDGYTARARAEQLLAGLGFQQDEIQKPLSAFSGGWRIRLNLARTLMTPSDFLLLDEPTNHLDLDTIIWLVDWIKHYQGAMLLISHDREFLDETVDSIAYLHHQQVEMFSGNYSQFEVVKAARLAEQQSSYVKQQREVQHMQDFVRRFRAKATKAKQAQSRIKALAKMELIAPAHIDSPFEFKIPPAEKTSDPLLSLDQAVLGYETPVVSNVRLNLHPGDRIGLLGHNGAGKSTLIKTLSGELPLLAGQRHEGANLFVGYFSQHQVDELSMTSSAFDHIRQLDPNIREQAARTFLGGFDFRNDKVFEPVKLFSGGEKARLALALVAYQKPNLLLMDEPTNHLDMDMRQALTIALQEFEGAILLISHDRHLLANTVDQFLLVHDGRVDIYDGDLNDYRNFLLGRDSQQKRSPAKAIQAPRSQAAPAAPKGKTNHKETRQLKTRLKTIETRLERLQEKLQEVETALSDTSLYSDDGNNQADNLQDLLRSQVSLTEEIAIAEETWLEITEQLES